MVSTLLVQAQATPSESGLREEKWYLPLGLLSIATNLDYNGFSNVSVLDADHDSIEDILQKISQEKPDIVGVNFNVFNTDLLDRTVKTAKESGSFTIIGGQAATPISKRLLQNNFNIDAVCLYDGENTMVELAQRFEAGNRTLQGISNIVYRDADNIIIPNKKDLPMVDLASLPSINRRIKGFDFDQYLSSWNRLDIDKNRVPTSMYMQKGCGKTCTFCARVDKKIRQRKPGLIYEEIKKLAEDEGVNYIYVVDDTFASDKVFLQQLEHQYKTKGDLAVQFWAFADVRDLDDVRLKLLQSLHVEKVLIGIETGDEKLRAKNGKIYSNEFLFERLEALARTGIKLEDSYVLGLAGETEETLVKTYGLAKKIASICRTEGSAFNIMTPLLGSPDWNRLMHIPEMQVKYAKGYAFDIRELRDDYFKAFCHISGGSLE